MADSTIEPALTEHLARLRAEGRSERVSVIIEPSARVPLDEGGDPLSRLEAQQRRLAAAQQTLIEQLEELGVQGPVRSSPLANALFAELTPEQIEAVAMREDVHRIRWQRPQKVTT